MNIGREHICVVWWIHTKRALHY